MVHQTHKHMKVGLIDLPKDGHPIFQLQGTGIELGLNQTFIHQDHMRSLRLMEKKLL